MLFDQVGELPVATLRPRSRSRLELIGIELDRWIVACVRWFRPRAIPVTVALLGMLAMIGSVSYLHHHPNRATRAAESINASFRASGHGMMFIDGKPHKNGVRLPDLEPSGYRVRLVLQQ